MEDAISSLLNAPLTDEMIAECARAVISATHSFLGVASAEGAIAVEKAGRQGWLDLLPRVRAFLEPPAADMAEWAVRSQIAYLEATLPSESVQESVRGKEMEVLALVAHPVAGGFLRAQVLIMAIFEAMQTPEHRERANELAERAFLDASAFCSLLSSFGLNLDPFANESVEARQQRESRYLEHARSAIGDDETAAMAEARLGILR
jgi:hypothetical protein